MKGCRPGKRRLAKVSKRRINCQSLSMRGGAGGGGRGAGIGGAIQSANLRSRQFVQAMGKK